MVHLTRAFSALSLALALSPALAERASRVHVRVHGQPRKADAACADGGQSVSVVSWPEAACIAAGLHMCVADWHDGACPDGSVCAPVAASEDYSAWVYGCVPAEWLYWEDEAPPAATAGDCSGEGESPMSVVGWAAVSCVSGDACVASNSEGACPADAVCDLVTYDASDKPVYGCYATNLTSYGSEDESEDKSEDDYESEDESEVNYESEDEWAGGCADGEQTVGVMGWSHDGCVPADADVCVAQVADGVCPDGAVCEVVSEGAGEDVYGCADAASAHRYRLHQRRRRHGGN